jgi:aminopeptidase YwaD
MITDTAFFRNPHYHGPTDTLETLNIDFMAKVCEGVIRGVLAL